MKLIRNIMIISLLALGLSACSSIEQHMTGIAGKDNKYLKAHSSKHLMVPAGLSSSKVGDDFSIPPVTGHGTVPASIVPPGGL